MCSIQSIITIVKIYTKQINSRSCCNVFKLSFFWVYYQYTKNSECIDIQGLLQWKNTLLPCVKTARERHGKLYHVYKIFRFFFSIGQTIMTLLYRQTKGKIGLNFDTFIASLELRTSSVFVDSFYSDKTLPRIYELTCT